MKPSIQAQLEQKLKRRLSQLPPYIDDYIYSLKDSKEIRSRIEYVKDLTLFFDFLYARHSFPLDLPYDEVPITFFETLTPRDISEFMDYLTHYTKLNAQGTGVVTYTNNQKGKSRKLATLRQWFKYLQREKHISRNVAQDIDFSIKERHTIKRILTNEEVQALMQTIASGAGVKNNYALHLVTRDYTICSIFAYTGVRVSELVQLDIDDLRLNDKTMVVTRKGGHQELVILSSALTECLIQYLDYRHALTVAPTETGRPLFLSTQNKRLTDDAVRKMLSKYGKLIGLSENLSPHMLRRTFGTNHYKQNHDMSLTASLLGHASLETTRRHYVEIDDERKRDSLENFTY